MIMFVPFIF